MAIQETPQMRVVAIIHDGTSCKITPTDTLARREDEIAFCNLTSGPMTVMFPDAGLFGKSTFPIPMGKSQKLPVLASAPFGSYEYSIYCEASKQFAHASIPRIIIYTEPT